jgi:hypothetical protein
MIPIDPPQFIQAIYLDDCDREGYFYGSTCRQEQYYEISKSYPIRAEDDISYYNANIPVICPACTNSACILLPTVDPHGKNNLFRLPIKDRCLNYSGILENLYVDANAYGKKQIVSVYERLDNIIKLCDVFEIYLTLFHYKEYSVHMKAINAYLYMQLYLLMQNKYIITLALLKEKWTFFIRGERAQQLLTAASNELHLYF